MLQPHLQHVDCLELVTHLCWGNANRWTTFIARFHGPDTPKEIHDDLFHVFYRGMSPQTAVAQGRKDFSDWKLRSKPANRIPSCLAEQVWKSANVPVGARGESTCMSLPREKQHVKSLVASES